MFGCKTNSRGLLLCFSFTFSAGAFAHEVAIPTAKECVYVLRSSLNDPERIAAYKTVEAARFEDLLESERRVALEYLLDNFLENGAVAAATSSEKPNYRYYWHRDAALVYATLWKETKDHKYLYKFIEAEKAFLAKSSAGEPKSELDFNAFTDPWARPQNDGPALAILTLDPISYNPDAIALIKKLADYVESMKNFAKDVEPWEEDHGKHFYNGLAQYTALLKAAAVALRDGNPALHDQYRATAYEIKSRLDEKHWDAETKRLIPTIDRPEGEERHFYDKVEDLDIQILLAYLHTETPLTDSKLMSSFDQLRQSFIREYSINQSEGPYKYAVAMGRYPNDQWDGVTRTGASPWFISTFASAEFFFKLFVESKSTNKITIDETNQNFYRGLIHSFFPEHLTRISGEVPLEISSSDPLFQALQSSYKSAGDEFLMLGLSHGGRDGRLSEQFNRDNGYMQGAENLTWSYAALLSALQARRSLSSPL